MPTTAWTWPDRAARAAAVGGKPVSGRKRRGGRRDVRAPRAPISGAHPDERDPQLLDTTVGKLVADQGWELDLRMHGVFARWAELVGAEVGGALDAGVLHRGQAAGPHRLDRLGDAAEVPSRPPSSGASTRSWGTAR